MLFNAMFYKILLQLTIIGEYEHRFNNGAKITIARIRGPRGVCSVSWELRNAMLKGGALHYGYRDSYLRSTDVETAARTFIHVLFTYPGYLA